MWAIFGGYEIFVMETAGTTTGIIMILAAMWVILFIVVSAFKEHTYFLVAVGTVGMIHTNCDRRHSTKTGLVWDPIQLSRSLREREGTGRA